MSYIEVYPEKTADLPPRPTEVVIIGVGAEDHVFHTGKDRTSFLRKHPEFLAAPFTTQLALVCLECDDFSTSDASPESMIEHAAHHRLCAERYNNEVPNILAKLKYPPSHYPKFAVANQESNH